MVRVLAAEDAVEGLPEDVVAVVSVVVVGARMAVVEEAVEELLGATAGRDVGEAAPLRAEKVPGEGGDQPEEARLAGGVPESLDRCFDLVLGDPHAYISKSSSASEWTERGRGRSCHHGAKESTGR
jgi:hypothetical protein